MSDAVHACCRAAYGLPAEKRFHRFIELAPENYIYPDDRGDNSTIIEISLFAGRTAATKKALINLLFERFQNDVGISAHYLEITIFETAPGNRGVRGVPGDELTYNYKIDV